MTNKTLAILSSLVALVGLVVNVAIDRDNVYDMTLAGLWVATLVLAVAGAFVGGGKLLTSTDVTLKKQSSSLKMDKTR
ncbi:MAG: hypothetical protein ACRDF4_11645 [Rhabdochlamydiaceae bacterium]